MQSSNEDLAQLKWKFDDAVLNAQCLSLPFFQSHTAGICLPGCSLPLQNPCLLKRLPKYSNQHNTLRGKTLTNNAEESKSSNLGERDGIEGCYFR